MNAEWNVNKIAEMNHEENLRNTCLQIEEEYVQKKRHATHGGYVISRQWPRLGECNHWIAKDYILAFRTTTKRSIQIVLPSGEVIAEHPMKPGLANELYLEAGRILDLWESNKKDAQ